jgi:hypothetical protein
MALDQKYCVSCGGRRGNLPSRVASVLAAFDMPAPPTLAGIPPMAVSAAPPTSGLTAAIDNWLEDGDYPSPRICAVAVMALLAFGVLLGSVVGATSSLSPIYVMPPATTQAAALPADQPLAEALAATDDAAPATETPAATPAPPAALPAAATVKIKHVWLIVLSDQGYAKTWGDPAAQSYLTGDLRSQGTVVENYYSVAQGELANMNALVSGQGPTWQITQNCPNYNDITPGTIDAATKQVQGDGCVFPAAVTTLPDAVVATGGSARGYFEDIDAGGVSSCRHPASGAADPDHTTSATNSYASWSNPLAYFRSITDSTECANTIAGLGKLDSDLAGSAPAFSLIVPSRCHDASDTPCAPGAASGITSADSFLQTVVPKITASKDYADGGLIAVTFDQAPQGAPSADVSSCCGQPVFPNLASPPAVSVVQPPAVNAPTSVAGETGETGETGSTGGSGATGTAQPTPATAAPSPTYVQTTPTGEAAGGGKVGLLLISPFIQSGGLDVTAVYNHFSLLQSIETYLGTEKLGYSADPALTGINESTFSKQAAG